MNFSVDGKYSVHCTLRIPHRNISIEISDCVITPSASDTVLVLEATHNDITMARTRTSISRRISYSALSRRSDVAKTVLVASVSRRGARTITCFMIGTKLLLSQPARVCACAVSDPPQAQRDKSERLRMAQSCCLVLIVLVEVG